MENLYRIFLFLWLLCAIGCSSESKKLAMPDIKGKPDTVQLVTESWDRLLNHCPGLNRYQGDMEYAGLNDTLGYPGQGDMERVEVEFRISNDPKLIPNDFQAWGHTCSFGISPDGSKLRIQKAACTSVCLDRKYVDSGRDYLGVM